MVSEKFPMMYVGATSMSAAAEAWRSFWWISAAHNRPKVELPACDLPQSSTTRVKYISPFLLPAIAVLGFSLNLIFVPFPMEPVLQYFSRVKHYVFFHPHTLSIKPNVKPLCWKEISHSSEIQCLGGIKSIESIYLCSRTVFNMHNHQLNCNEVFDQWIFVIMTKQTGNEVMMNNRKIIKNTKWDLSFQYILMVLCFIKDL